MARMKTGILCLSALGTVGVLVCAGWTLHANAGQTSRRPYIPRPNELRPLQPPPSSSPPRAGGSGVPAIQPPKPSDSQSKQGQLEGLEFLGIDKTGAMSFRDFIYTEGDMKVTGARARYSNKTKILDADGSLVMDDPKHHMTGDKTRYDNHPDIKLAVFTGNVVIVMKPKDKPAGDNGSDVEKEKSTGGTAYCDRLDYHKLRDFAILTGHLVFKQKINKDDGTVGERTLTAEHAEYDGKADKMHLFAPVDVVDTDNQKFHFDTDVFIGTKAGDETVASKGRFTATINIDDDNSGTAAPKPGDKKAPDGDRAPAGGKQYQPPGGTDSKQDPPVKKNP